MQKHLGISVLMAWAFMVPFTICAQKAPYLSRFNDVKTLDFKIYHGNLNIIGTSSGEVEISGISQSPAEMPVTKMKGNTLSFSENSQVDGSSPDWPVWTLKVPQNIDLHINISGGDVNIENITGNMDCNVGAGNIKLHKTDGSVKLNGGTARIDLTASTGSFEGNTGTGDVNVKDVQGSVTFNTGTGKINVSDVVITQKSALSSGTGKVFLGGKSTLKEDISLSSGTADACIDLSKLHFDGTLELGCSKKQGRIQAPFSFDSEKDKRSRGENSIVKTKKFGKSQVTVRVSSGLGTAEAQI
jgi:hypothetical protein